MTARWLAALALVTVLGEPLLAQKVPGDRPPRPRWVRLNIAYGPFGPTIQAIVIPPRLDPGSYLQGPPPRFDGDLPGPGADPGARPNPPPRAPERTKPPARPADARERPPVHDLKPNATVRPGKYSVDMALDPRTLEEFSRAFAVGDRQTMTDLYTSHRVVEVKAPLRVVRLNTLRDLAYVRVAEGPFAGTVYVVPDRFVFAD